MVTTILIIEKSSGIREYNKFFEKNRKYLGEEEFVNSIKKQFNI